MIAFKIDQATRILSESKAARPDVRTKPKARLHEEDEEVREKMSLKDNEDEVHTVLANILAVGLAQIEDMTGMVFEDAKEAQAFLLQALQGLRGKGKSKLAAAMRKFDRLGPEQTKRAFKRQLAK